MQAVSARFLTITGVAASALLVGCNAPDTGTGSNMGTTNASAAGVWSGSDSVSGLGLAALINSAGQAMFLRSDGVLFSGAAQVSGNTLVLTADGYSAFPAAFSDGSTYGVGTVNGTVTTGGSISATLSFTTNGGTAITGNWSLSYSALSNDSSSTATISGNYTDATTGAVLSINGNGSMTSQNANNGCVLNGVQSCPGCIRREQLPGGTFTHWKTPSFHGAPAERTFRTRRRSPGSDRFTPSSRNGPATPSAFASGPR